eukprot:m.1389521 g.1389521  ORF g.1389521 m.1389521 type:complete len:529 (+) comp24987_c0_seq73:335-1921(+)
MQVKDMWDGSRTVRRTVRPRLGHAKTSEKGSSVDTESPAHIIYSHCSCRGLRPTMEDEVACRLDLAGIPGSGFFGVFDGHGGSAVSKYAAQVLPSRLVARLQQALGVNSSHVDHNEIKEKVSSLYTRSTFDTSLVFPNADLEKTERSAAAVSTALKQHGNVHLPLLDSRGRFRRHWAGEGSAAIPTDVMDSETVREVGAAAVPAVASTGSVSSWPPCVDSDFNTQVRQAVYDVFLETDATSREDVQSYTCGTTANTVLILQDHYVFANAGDSRSILVSGGEVAFATLDHKPGDARERQRIYNAGGFVLRGRVDGQLAVARALGDHTFKNTMLPQQDQMVTAAPDICFVDRRVGLDDFIVLACDGVWDVMTNAAVAHFVAGALAQQNSVDAVAAMLVDTALARGSTDNLSVVIVAFVDGSIRRHCAAACEPAHTAARTPAGLARSGHTALPSALRPQLAAPLSRPRVLHRADVVTSVAPSVASPDRISLAVPEQRTIRLSAGHRPSRPMLLPPLSRTAHIPVDVDDSTC